MSSSMARPKSRWKVAAITGAAMATLIPAAARATLTVNLSLSNTPAFLGGAGGIQTSNYLTRDTTAVPIYVYATVTGSGTLSGSDFNGLDYLYYDIANGAPGTATGIPGTITTSLNSNFSGNGSQAGTTSVVNPGSPGTVVGGNTLLAHAKPEAPSMTRWSSIAADGTNVITTANSVSFLVETLTFHPSTFNASSVGSLNTTTFSVSVPGAGGGIVSPYAPANWYEDSNVNTSPGQLSAARNGVAGSGGGTYAPGSHATVTLTDTELGDSNADGTVDFTDFTALSGNFNTGTTWAQGDFKGTGVTDFTDFTALSGAFGHTLGGLPAGLNAGPTAEVAGGAVPEPTSLSLLGLGGLALVGRRRRMPR